MHKWSCPKIMAEFITLRIVSRRTKSADDDLILKTSRTKLLIAGGRAFTSALIALEYTWAKSGPYAAGSTNERWCLVSSIQHVCTWQTKLENSTNTNVLKHINRLWINYIFNNICQLSLLARNNLVYGATVIRSFQLLIRVGGPLMNPTLLLLFGTDCHIHCQQRIL